MTKEINVLQMHHFFYSITNMQLKTSTHTVQYILLTVLIAIHAHTYKDSQPYHKILALGGCEFLVAF